ncbi:hypothetical protein HYALB_00012846, partial [Hymenoscyphus albidus]
LRYLVIGISLLGLSIVLNVVLALKVFGVEVQDSTGTTTSIYAKLPQNIDDSIIWNTEFSGENTTEVDRLWYDTIPWESGIIALRNSEAESMGLPLSQPFPWDGKEKSTYIINGHHILHCVRNIYISIQEYRNHQEQSIFYPHILHCLDSIRLETLCAADDTPRYVPFNGENEKKPGDGQIRKCRDWSKLEKWAQDHDACYRYIEPGNDEISNLERFKFCANDSPYVPIIRGYFGYEDTWLPRKETI